MDPEQLDRKLDGWLDEASAAFGRAETRPGLEARMVAKLHARLERRPWWRGWRVLTAAAAISLAFSIWVIYTRFQEGAVRPIVSNSVTGTTDRVQKSAGITSAAGNQTPGREAAAPGPYLAANRPARSRAIPPEPLPRLEVFPSPEVSEQERLLLAYARLVSKGMVSGLAEDTAPQPTEAPKLEIPLLEIPKLEIAPIKIEPLSEKRDF